MRRLGLLLLLPVFLLLGGWDTRVIEREAWRSAYFADTSTSLAEHSTLSDLALDELGVGGLFGIRGTARATLVDINASYFRAGAHDKAPREGDDRSTLLEERLLPPPAQFSGLPDYSYGPADWLNKNRVCPTGDDGGDGLCFSFTGWMGALNSVHFGTQAQRMYARYHAIAVQRAERARRFREALTPPERLAYAGALREAELQALMYEGYAQHFLQDRWAIGHMWERWNGPDRRQAAHQSVLAGIAVGGVAGLIHGSESVQNKSDFWRGLVSTADPMSSPLPGPDGARPMRFRHVTRPDIAPIPAVGDERLADMRLGHFGAHYGGQQRDVPLDVRVQRDTMMACSKAGWAEVIRAFGPGPGGGYGIHAARLRADAPRFAVLERATCWDMWATNRSMYVGYLGEGTNGIKLLGSLHVAATLDGVSAAPVGWDAVLTTNDLVALSWTMWRRQWLDPDGTDLARGSIGALWGARTGDAFDLPSYAEPVDPEALPAVAANGVDQRTLFGAMPLAHSDGWCDGESMLVLQELRRSGAAVNQQACQYLADLSWQGTHPDYAGRMSRTRSAPGGRIRSICHARRGARESGADDPQDPFYIDQGYTSRTEARDRAPAFGSRAAANWCARTPVVRLSRDPALRNANIIQVLGPSARRIELAGQDFGLREGDVYIYEEGRQRRTRGRVVDWSDNRIQIDLRPGDLPPGRDYLVEIATTDERRSVGLFLLRVSKSEPPAAPVAVAGACDAPPPAPPNFDVGQAVARRLGGPPVNADPRALAAAMKAVTAEFSAAQNGMRVYYLKERACILARQPGGERAIERMTREGRVYAQQRAADYYSSVRRIEGDFPLRWGEHCASGVEGRPVELRPLYGGTPFRPRGALWSDYARELDGVIQYTRFAETYMAAVAMALETPGPYLAPGGSRPSNGYDHRLRDPAAVLRRYFRASGQTPPPPGRVDRIRTTAMMYEFESWAGGVEMLHRATLAGIRDRREYETWLTTRLRAQAADPLDAYCRMESALVRPGAPGLTTPDSGSWVAASGQRYRRIGWPSPGWAGAPAPFGSPGFQGPVIAAPPGR